MKNPLTDTYWLPTKDGDPRASALFKRHYSALPYMEGRRRGDRYRNRHQIVGPGEKMVLITTDGRALFVWRKFIDKSKQTGINCAIFRNESNDLSSELILEAEQHAWRRWPGERLYTFINPKKIRSTNPGYCFKVAGWEPCGHTKKRQLLILEKYPLTIDH